MGLPRVALLLRLARRQGALQADCDWRPMGCAPTTLDHGCVHSFLWSSRQAALQWPPLSRLLFHRARPLDLFLHRAPKLHQRRRRQSARYHQSLFPTARPPLSAVVSGLVDFAIGFVVLLVVTAIYGIKPTLAMLWLPVLLLLAVLTALGVGLWMSALNALYRDVRYVVPFLVQFWMFASPVAYPSSLVPQRWRWLYGLNPMAGVIDGFRWALTGHGVAPGPLVLASASAVMVVVLGGLFFFQRMEGTIADRV